MAATGAAMVSRALGWLGLAVGGVLLGAAGVVVQAATGTVAGHGVPWGLPVTLATLAVAIRGGVWLARRRLGGVPVALGWTLSTVLLAQSGPGGDVLLPEGVHSQVYLIGGVVVAALAVAWPLPAGTGRARTRAG